MKLFLEESSITTDVLGKAIVGAIIAAKTVAILDAAMKLEWLENRPRYLSVLYRTFVYTLAALILGNFGKGKVSLKSLRLLSVSQWFFVSTISGTKSIAIGVKAN